MLDVCTDAGRLVDRGTELSMDSAGDDVSRRASSRDNAQTYATGLSYLWFYNQKWTSCVNFALDTWGDRGWEKDREDPGMIIREIPTPTLRRQRILTVRCAKQWGKLQWIGTGWLGSYNVSMVHGRHLGELGMACNARESLELGDVSRKSRFDSFQQLLLAAVFMYTSVLNMAKQYTLASCLQNRQLIRSLYLLAPSSFLLLF